MNATDFKKSLIKYRNYEPLKEHGLISMEDNMISTIFWLIRTQNNNIQATMNLNKLNSKKDKIDESTLEEKDYDLEYLESSISNLNNYKKNNFILYILEQAHNNWMIENGKKLDFKKIKDARKFIPFKMMEWKDATKYMQVLQPILGSLGLEYDKNELENQFNRDKLCFMFKYLIYSKESLIENLKKTEDFYPELVYEKNDNGVRFTDRLKKETVINQIADQVDENSDLNLANQLKKVLMFDKDNIGMAYNKLLNERKGEYHYEENLGQRKFGFKKMSYPRFKAPISKGLFEIANQDIIMVKNIKSFDYKYVTMSNTRVYHRENVQFIPFEKCSDENKKLIEKREKKQKKLLNKVNLKNSAKYKEPGLITFVLLANEKVSKIEKSRRTILDKPSNIEIIQVQMTKEEIAKLGYLPEELGWEKKKRALVNSQKSVLITSDKDFDNQQNDNRKKSDKTNDFFENLKIENDYKKDKNEKIEENSKVKNKEKNIDKDITD